MDWATAADVQLGLRLAVALENFWITQDAREGIRRFELLLERAEGIDPLLHARALRDYGGCSDWSMDLDRARPAYERSRELFRELGDESGVATAAFRLGVLACKEGDLAEGRRLYEKSLEIFRRIGDEIGELQALGNLGWLEAQQGDLDGARALIEQSLAMGRKAGWVWWEAAQLGLLAEIALEAGRIEEANAQGREYLALARSMGDRQGTMCALSVLAWAAADGGDPERSVTLWTAVEHEATKGRLYEWEAERDHYAAHVPKLPKPGTPLPLDEAVEYALEGRIEAVRQSGGVNT
jgi:tetratricopeptide (TPR) repeat protein